MTQPAQIIEIYQFDPDNEPQHYYDKQLNSQGDALDEAHYWLLQAELIDG